MSFIEWITRRPGFRSLEDSFAINRESMLRGLRRAIDQQRKRSDEVWLVVHFFDTFVMLQDFLGEEEIDYVIVDQLGNSLDDASDAESQPTPVKLALSSLVVAGSPAEAQSNRGGSGRNSLAIIVCERHPHYLRDKELFEVVRRLEATITFGYVLSLDDVVVERIVSPMALEVLKQLGLDNDEMIASHYLSRLLERRLLRDASRYTGNFDADSAAEWIKLNSE